MEALIAARYYERMHGGRRMSHAQLTMILVALLIVAATWQLVFVFDIIFYEYAPLNKRRNFLLTFGFVSLMFFSI